MHTSLNTTPSGTTSYRVWDPLVRVFHWALVTCVLANYFVTEAGETLHQWLGYGACALVTGRLVWGFVGTTHARFSDFWPTSRRVYGHICSLLSGNPTHYIGHSPLGAVMMLTLMVLVLLLGLTGWMQGLDQFFGDESIMEMHEVLSHAIIMLAGLHGMAAVILGHLEKTNLIKAMLTGVKHRQ